MPETSALQCWQSEAAKWHRLVGFGCRPRCAPACGLRFGLRCSPSLPLCPRDGGVLELSGFFGGRLSLARSSAFSARSAAFSASNISNRDVKSFRRSNNARASAPFPALSRRAKSGGRVIHRGCEGFRIPRRSLTPSLLGLQSLLAGLGRDSQWLHRGLIGL